MRITKRYVNDLAYKIVGAAIEVHKILGPGLLESIYEECLFEELKLRGLNPLDKLSCKNANRWNITFCKQYLQRITR